MSAPTAPAAPAQAAPKRGRKLLVLIVVGLVCSAAGAAVPMVIDVPGLSKGSHKEEAKGKDHADELAATATVPFGEVVVNLAEERMQRYLRVKIAVQVDGKSEKEVSELLTKHKAAVKSKLIGHIAGKTLKDVSGSVGVARLQRELLERIEDVLYPNGGGHVRCVLFEEYVVQ